jgi:hypothetical protein
MKKAGPDDPDRPYVLWLGLAQARQDLPLMVTRSPRPLTV